MSFISNYHFKKVARVCFIHTKRLARRDYKGYKELVVRNDFDIFLYKNGQSNDCPNQYLLLGFEASFYILSAINNTDDGYGHPLGISNVEDNIIINR